MAKQKAQALPPDLPLEGGWQRVPKEFVIDESRNYSPEFEQFWEAYPRHTNKYLSWISWQRARKAGFKHGLMLLRAQQFAESDVGRNVLRYIPHACTWLNQRRFLDDPEAWTFTRVSTGGANGTQVDWNYKA